MDDGSPDSCGKICDEYAKLDRRVIVIHTENRGLSSARNMGLKNATASHIAFVDSDDYVSPDYLEAIHDTFASTQADCVFFERTRVAGGRYCLCILFLF